MTGGENGGSQLRVFAGVLGRRAVWRTGVRRLLWLAATVILANAVMYAQAQPSYGRGKLDALPYRDRLNRFTFEFPKKDWLTVPGGGSSLVTVTQKNTEATVVIEYQRMTLPLELEDITDLFGQLEQDVVKGRDPSAADVAVKMIADQGRRLAIVDYRRTGVKGPEVVRQFSIPVGQDLYRIICSTSAAGMQKYSGTFAHIAASFTPTTK